MFNSGGSFGFDMGALLGNMMGGNNRNGGGFADGNGWWVLIILFALFGGWGQNGYGRNGNGGSCNSNGGGTTTVMYPAYGFGANSAAFQGALTRGDLCMDMNFNNLQNSVRDISDTVNTGFANLNATICHQQYDTANLINNLGNVIQGGFNSANVVALQNQNALQNQLQTCCCNLERGQMQAEYNRAADTCAITNAIQNAARDIIQNDNCNYRQLHDEQVATQIQGYKAQIDSLTAALNRCDIQNVANAAVQSAVNQIRPTPTPSWPVPNPWSRSCCCDSNACCG